MLERMGICPESSHHESGPGQNEIDFRYSAPSRLPTTPSPSTRWFAPWRRRTGSAPAFPLPLADCDGNGMHINVSVKCDGNTQPLPSVIAGILENIREMTLFLNPCEESYCRLGSDKAPLYVTWSAENRSQLIRIPAAVGEYRRAELRSADPMTNPYIAYTLLIYAGMYGFEHDLQLCPASDFNVYTAPAEVLDGLEKLPVSLSEGCRAGRGERIYPPASPGGRDLCLLPSISNLPEADERRGEHGLSGTDVQCAARHSLGQLYRKDHAAAPVTDYWPVTTVHSVGMRAARSWRRHLILC